MNIVKELACSRIKELIISLNYNTELYDLGKPEITDKQWDDMYFELVELEQQYPEFIFSDSPTQKVIYTVANELKKVKHEYQPMLSLDKTKDIEEIKSFIGNRDWIAMLKLDGLTCRLTYEGGKLVRAETRGDGTEGEDITHNAMVLPSIPKTVKQKLRLVVDGEVICDKKIFKKFEDKYANCRNFAAGSIRLLNSAECAQRGLTFVAWDIIEGASSSYLSERLDDLSDMNFRAVPYITNRVFDIFDQSSIDCLLEDNKACQYPIDGIVVKYDDCLEYYEAGRTDHHFRGGLAYKFYDDEYETELLDIEWSMGRTGVLSPVAIYKPIEIDGAECSRANLHNLNTMRSVLGELPITGQKIWVYKANAIIPQISKAEDVGNKLGIDPAYLLKDPEIRFLLPPLKCPICGAQTEKRKSDSGTIELYCSGDQCSGKLINQLDHFAGKKGLDIKGLSKATLEKLIDWGWVTRAMDLFYLYQREHEWINKPGFGAKSVKKILDAIEEARHTTLEKYLSAISIPLIGKTYARQLTEEFNTYWEFRSNVDANCDFTLMPGFGPAMHEAIMNFDYTEADMMVDRYIIDFIQEENALNNSTKSFEGLVFCITGKLQHHKNRDELKAKIEAVGGKVSTSVSSKTSYLINNDINSTSSKNKTAKELNIPIITEEELLGMLN